MANEMTKIPFECPVCGAVGYFPVFDTFDLEESETIRKYVRSGSFFTYKCSQCQHKEDITYTVACWDSKTSFLLSVAESDEDRAGAISVFNEQDKRLIRCRLVSTTQEMSEKIRLADAKLDDHIIEILKIMIMGELADLTGDIEKYGYADSEVKYYYRRTKDGIMYFDIQGSDDYESYTLPLEAYIEIDKVYKGIPKSGYVVDRMWASQFMDDNPLS